MAHVGQVITNPITHELITFRKTTQETGGQMLVFDCRVTPGGTPLPPHVHTTQEERFAIPAIRIRLTQITLKFHGPGSQAGAVS